MFTVVMVRIFIFFPTRVYRPCDVTVNCGLRDVGNPDLIDVSLAFSNFKHPLFNTTASDEGNHTRTATGRRSTMADNIFDRLFAFL